MLAAKKKPLFYGRRVTREEYLDLPDDGFDYRMSKGILRFERPSGTPEHGRSYGRFFRFLDQYLDKNPLGELTQETDVLLPDGGDVIRPDLSFVLNENRSILLKHIHGTPDLICEALSDGTAKRDLGEKADRYLQCGVREYWIVDPLDKSMQLWVNINKREWKKTNGALLESKLLPGLEIEVAKFWR